MRSPLALVAGLALAALAAPAVAAAAAAAAAPPAAAARRLAAVAHARALQPSPPAPSTNLTCDTCQFIAGVVQEIAENKTTIAEMTALLDEACSAIGDATVTALCDAIMAGLSQLLPFLDDQMRTLAWDIPLTFCSVIFPVCKQPCCDASAPLAPEQLHLALTGDPGEMGVTWVTLNATAGNVVRWGAAGSGSFPTTAAGSAWTYTNGGWVGVIHAATMTGLSAGASYDYQVGDGAAQWSATRTFATLPADVGSAARPLRIAQIGDMAYDVNSDNTVAQIAKLVAAGQIDVIMHIGDISYADGEQHHWDLFMRKVEPISSTVPYLVTRGNHVRPPFTTYPCLRLCALHAANSKASFPPKRRSSGSTFPRTRRAG
jgi:hypothetical protein